MTRMELFTDFLHNLLHRAALNNTILYFSPAPIDSIKPLRLRIRINGRVKTGEQPVRQKGSVFLW